MDRIERLKAMEGLCSYVENGLQFLDSREAYPYKERLKAYRKRIAVLHSLVTRAKSLYEVLKTLNEVLVGAYFIEIPGREATRYTAFGKKSAVKIEIGRVEMRLATISEIERRLTADAVQVQATIFGGLRGCRDASLLGEWVSDKVLPSLQSDGSIRLDELDTGDVSQRRGVSIIYNLVDEALAQYPEMFKHKKGVTSGQDIEEEILETIRQQGAIPIH